MSAEVGPIPPLEEEEKEEGDNTEEQGREVFDKPSVDDEGRVVLVEVGKNGKHLFYILCVYTPNAGGDLGRLTHRVKWWDVAF